MAAATRAEPSMTATMEGFMYKKGKGASAFGRTNWSKRWFELDGTHLSYWEGFSPAADRPLGEPKGRVAVRGARLVEDVAHRQRAGVFGISRGAPVDVGASYGALGLALGDAPSLAKVPRSPLCLLYTSPSPRDRTRSRMPSSA